MSSAVTSEATLTGAAKPRLTESTGRCATPPSVKLCSALVSVSTPRTTARPSSSDSDMSRPSAPTSPIASGITIGSFTGWPGVGGTVCADLEPVGLRLRVVARRSPSRPACRLANTSA